MQSWIPSRSLQAAVALITCLCLAIAPIRNHFKGNALGGPNKDYPLWYLTGQKVIHGEEVYPTEHDKGFPFMYPPFAGVLLGGLSMLGCSGMFLALILLNIVSFMLAVELSVRMVAGSPNVSIWLRTIPVASCIFFVYDMFFLGQPNLGLLVLILGGLMLVRKGMPVSGGLLFATAAALKAFPVVAIVYLVWRREWKATLAMIIGAAAFLVLLPASVRGFDRSIVDLQTWTNSMVLQQGSDGYGQRPEQSISWKNQSIFGIGHRLLRHVNAEAEDFLGEKAAVYVNVLSLDYRSATMIIVMSGLGLGLVYVSVIPRRANRTRETDALEYGMLVVLITLCTPYAFTYYFVWLIYPFTVSIYQGISGRDRTTRRIGWLTAILAMMLQLPSAPVYGQHHLLMAYGIQFWSCLVLLAGMSALMVRCQRPIAEPITVVVSRVRVGNTQRVEQHQLVG